MREGQFEHEIFIQAKPAEVISFWANLHNHPRVHPLIVNVEEVTPPPGVLHRYWITDQLQWGPFRFRIRYRADILKVSENEILSEAYQSPKTYVTNHSIFNEENDGTRLHEKVTIKAPDLLFSYAFQQAKAAHAGLLQNLKRVLEEEERK